MRTYTRTRSYRAEHSYTMSERTLLSESVFPDIDNIQHFVCNPTTRRCVGGYNRISKFNMDTDGQVELPMSATYQSNQSVYRMLLYSTNNKWLVFASGQWERDSTTIPSALAMVHADTDSTSVFHLPRTCPGYSLNYVSTSTMIERYSGATSANELVVAFIGQQSTTRYSFRAVYSLETGGLIRSIKTFNYPVVETAIAQAYTTNGEVRGDLFIATSPEIGGVEFPRIYKVSSDAMTHTLWHTLNSLWKGGIGSMTGVYNSEFIVAMSFMQKLMIFHTNSISKNWVQYMGNDVFPIYRNYRVFSSLTNIPHTPLISFYNTVIKTEYFSRLSNKLIF